MWGRGGAQRIAWGAPGRVGAQQRGGQGTLGCSRLRLGVPQPGGLRRLGVQSRGAEVAARCHRGCAQPLGGLCWGAQPSPAPWSSAGAGAGMLRHLAVLRAPPRDESEPRTLPLPAPPAAAGPHRAGDTPGGAGWGGAGRGAGAGDVPLPILQTTPALEGRAPGCQRFPSLVLQPAAKVRLAGDSSINYQLCKTSAAFTERPLALSAVQMYTDTLISSPGKAVPARGSCAEKTWVQSQVFLVTARPPACPFSCHLCKLAGCRCSAFHIFFPHFHYSVPWRGTRIL